VMDATSIRNTRSESMKPLNTGGHGMEYALFADAMILFL